MCDRADRIFLELVDECYQNNINLNIAATTVYQTLETLRIFTRIAKLDINIFARNLRKDIYEHELIIDCFSKFLIPGGDRRIRILLKQSSDEELDDHKFPNALRDNLGERVFIYFADDSKMRNCDSTFIVVDGCYYRLSRDSGRAIIPLNVTGEGKLKNPDDERTIWALMNFGNKVKSARLDSLFSTYLTTARPSKLNTLVERQVRLCSPKCRISIASLRS